MALVSCARSEAPHKSSLSAVAPAPTFVNGGRCGPSSDSRVPADAGCVTSIAAGDQRLYVYAQTGSDDLPKSWRIRLVTGQRVLVDRPLHAGNVTSYPRVIAATDVDQDGDADWWVKVRDYTSHGAPWAGMNLFVGIDDSIAPLRYQGSPLVIDFGGISRRGNGAACLDGDLVLLQADAQNRLNTKWAISQVRFSISRARAKLVRRTRGTLVIHGYNDPDLDPYYEVRCYGTNFSVFAPRPSP
ncbi:MAG: hypothetical protein QOC87_584 [Actinomycetota bacterium]|nr:hypothetical protein [Actinomycetota bacterium]